MLNKKYLAFALFFFTLIIFGTNVKSEERFAFEKKPWAVGQYVNYLYKNGNTQEIRRFQIVDKNEKNEFVILFQLKSLTGKNDFSAVYLIEEPDPKNMKNPGLYYKGGKILKTSSQDSKEATQEYTLYWTFFANMLPISIGNNVKQVLGTKNYKLGDYEIKACPTVVDDYPEFGYSIHLTINQEIPITGILDINFPSIKNRNIRLISYGFYNEQESNNETLLKQNQTKLNLDEFRAENYQDIFTVQLPIDAMVDGKKIEENNRYVVGYKEGGNIHFTFMFYKVLSDSKEESGDFFMKDEETFITKMLPQEWNIKWGSIEKINSKDLKQQNASKGLMLRGEYNWEGQKGYLFIKAFYSSVLKKWVIFEHMINGSPYSVFYGQLEELSKKADKMTHSFQFLNPKK